MKFQSYLMPTRNYVLGTEIYNRLWKFNAPSMRTWNGNVNICQRVLRCPGLTGNLVLAALRRLKTSLILLILKTWMMLPVH
eukprot:6228059-Karenia_brevis.AAC.1